MYRKLPWTGGDPREVAEIVNNLVEGKSNNTGDFSTTAQTTTTTIYNERIGYNSVILFTPMNDKAASEMAKLYVDELHQGYAIIAHDSNAHVCNFKYIVVG